MWSEIYSQLYLSAEKQYRFIKDETFLKNESKDRQIIMRDIISIVDTFYPISLKT